jgi:hypothetical protein
MQTQINDYRVRKSFTFGLFDATINPKIVSRIIATRALYCYIDKDFNMTRVKEGKLETSKINFHAEEYSTIASFKPETSDIDDFEKYYLAHISGEKLFRNFFFSKDIDYIDEYVYFIFQPIIIELEKDPDYSYQIYPVVKVVNEEVVIVDFNYFPNDNSESVEEFAFRLLRIQDKIKALKFPHAYFLALGFDVDKDQGELFSFESNESVLFTLKNSLCKNLVELAEMYVSILFTYEELIWVGRTVVSVDNTNLTKEQIQLIKYGFKITENNPLYDIEMINFSEHPSTKFFVFEHLTLTLGGILDTYIPATIIDEEISILNTKIYGFSKIVDDESLDELLKSKKELHLLKQQISLKYSRLLRVYKIIEYVTNDLLKINDQIDRIDALLENSFRQKEFSQTRRDNLYHSIIGIVSVILSMSVFFDYIIHPIYEIRFSREMPPIDRLLNYGLLVVVSFVILISIYVIVIYSKKGKEKSKK